MIDSRSPEPVTLNGVCHCGAVQFTVKLTEGFASARRCTCSICRMRGAVAVTSTPDAFRITQGEDKLATYRFNTKTAEHHFCSVCGIYTHHKRRSAPDQLGVNIAGGQCCYAPVAEAVGVPYVPVERALAAVADSTA